jgi:hypothetical protein
MTRRNLVTFSFAMPLFLATTAAQIPTDVSAVVDQYCSGCHNGTTKSPSGVLLTQFDPQHITADREAWTRASRILRAGAMPPAGVPRPDKATYDRTIAAIDRQLATPALEADSSQAIATRLATVLWNGAPDAALLKDASNDRLKDRAVLEAQVKRMLADPKAETFVERFFVPWLQLDQLNKAKVDKNLYPEYSDSLRDSMLRETQQFLLSQVREDRDPVELWSANYTFLNEELAKNYGVPAIKGADLRRYTWTTPERAGLLGQGSILMLTGRLDSPFTSPAARSTWLRRHYYGIAPPNPLPNAPNVKPGLPITPQTRTLPDNPCGTCHANFFPLGYSLENFDNLGRFRTQDQIGAADASGKFVDGTFFATPAEFRKGLLQHPDAFRTTITERLFYYAAGEPVKALGGTPETLAAARQILGDQSRPHWSAIIAGVIRSKSPALK